jgi:ribonuclease Z
MKSKYTVAAILLLLITVLPMSYSCFNAQTGEATSIIAAAHAAGGVVKGSNTVAPDRYVYYPGTEKLAEDEIRIVAAGTGMPAARRGQAATCFLVETGNGEKFIFDIGSGAMANLAALMIPYQYLDKIFLTHLHTDHMGDIDALWAGGWTAGRPNSLRVWGPSGARPEMGTKYAMDNFLKHANWDFTTRSVMISPVPGRIETTEFDYKGVNQVVYKENGVTIRSIPAIHSGDGPVSYIFEYKGMKAVIGGDTFPNKWFIKYAKDADFVIHECFMGPEGFVEFYNQPPQLAWRACCAFHTSGPAFGKVMSEIKPRHAVAYHFLNEEVTRYALYDQIRSTYDGPLSMANDLMVWNITKEKITERMAVTTEDAWAVPGEAIQPPPEKGRPTEYTPFILEGRWDEGAQPAQKELLDEFMEKHELQDQDWRKQMMKKKKQ